ncbi:hypothetical protein BG003_010817 [Podila horticola]|nr:hypothetical protein BG003_010817 [Podila horticola]
MKEMEEFKISFELQSRQMQNILEGKRIDFEQKKLDSEKELLKMKLRHDADKEKTAAPEKFLIKDHLLPRITQASHILPRTQNEVTQPKKVLISFRSGTAIASHGVPHLDLRIPVQCSFLTLDLMSIRLNTVESAYEAGQPA